jgi:tRNA-specific 2-thiouridylase
MNETSNNKIRVVVAMSGGVDSSVVAYLLKKEGYDVIGIFLKLWDPSFAKASESKTSFVCDKKKSNLCCDDKAMGVARQIADSLEIPFYVLKVDKLFKKEIVDNFISEYEKGRTPNPCVRCNKYIKSGYLWEKARQLKADYLATGHYIGKSQISNLKSQIFRSKDTIKDQTYFLSSIDPAIVPHLLFPLGNMTKGEVRNIAKKAKLPVYNKKDSMGVCFIPDGDTDSFLKHFSKKAQKPGNIVDKTGNILGKHSGLMGYTIGQRAGGQISNFQFPISNDGVASQRIKADIPRLYVVGIDSKKNRLIVGENEDCFSKEVVIENVNILDERFWDLVKNNKTLYAQIRGGHKAERCTISLIRTKPNEAKSYKLKAIFAKPVRAITPGQTIALYSKDTLIGGGIIS